MDGEDMAALDVALLTGNTIISRLLLTHGARTQLIRTSTMFTS